MEAHMRAVLMLALLMGISQWAQAQDADIPAQGQLLPVAGVDLGIADDETYRRPNSWSELETDGVGESHASILVPAVEKVMADGLSGPASRPGMSIAWRNAAQIEEVEVRVRNLGSEPAEGRLSVDVFDELGAILLHLEPPEEL